PGCDGDPRSGIGPGRVALRRAAAHVAKATHPLRRRRRADSLDGADLGVAPGRQPDAQRPHRLAVVRGLADRLRCRRRPGGLALGEDRHAAVRVVSGACGGRVRTREGRPLMRTGAVLLLAATLLAACDRLPGRPREADRPLRPHDVMSFEQLYGENCAGCHGVNGILGPATALANPTYLAWADDAALRRAITQGVPGTSMPAFAISAGGLLADAQIDALIHEMRAQWTTTPTPSGLPPYA